MLKTIPLLCALLLSASTLSTAVSAQDLPASYKQDAAAVTQDHFSAAAEASALPVRADGYAFSGLHDVGAYGFDVMGDGAFGPAIDSMQYYNPKIGNGCLLYDIQDTAPDNPFTTDLAATEKRWKQEGQDRFGKELDSFSFKSETVTDRSGASHQLYTVQFSVNAPDQPYSVTACYRFGDTYTAEFIGISNQELAEKFAEHTIYAATSFVDLGGERHSAFLHKEPLLGSENWPYSLHNPFAIVEDDLSQSQPLVEKEKPSKTSTPKKSAETKNTTQKKKVIIKKDKN